MFRKRLSAKFSLVILPLIAILLGLYVTFYSVFQLNILEDEIRVKLDNYVISYSQAIKSVFENAIDSGKFTKEQILNYEYTPITDPENPYYVEDATPIKDPYAIDLEAMQSWEKSYQKDKKQMRYKTPFSNFAKEVFTPIGDSYVNNDTYVHYCVVVDKYGYVPVHNSGASKPITGNPNQDDVQSRVFRFFKEETMLGVVNNTNKEGTKLLSYDRPLGNKLIDYWDISYPIFIKGEHWGAVRLGYIKEEALQKSMGIIIWFVIGAVGLLIVVFFAIYIPMKFLINRPISKLEHTVKTLSKGDLSARSPLTTTDELGRLSQSLNELTARFEQIIASVTNTIVSLSSATKEIAAGNQDLSQRTSEQASNLQEITAAMEEMSANIEATRRNAERTSELSNTLKTRIQGLNESSQKMHEIIQVIDSVSFETNLLALNASIEAARAGEAGKGFEVVASEVKELSQRSSSQAKEIYQIIDESIGSIKENVKLIEKMADLIGEINHSSQDQYESSQQISSSISQLNEVTQQNASLVEESAAASEEISSQAEELRDEIRFFYTENNENKNESEEITSMNEVKGLDKYHQDKEDTENYSEDTYDDTYDDTNKRNKSDNSDSTRNFKKK